MQTTVVPPSWGEWRAGICRVEQKGKEAVQRGPLNAWGEGGAIPCESRDKGWAARIRCKNAWSLMEAEMMDSKGWTCWDMWAGQPSWRSGEILPHEHSKHLVLAPEGMILEVKTLPESKNMKNTLQKWGWNKDAVWLKKPERIDCQICTIRNNILILDRNLGLQEKRKKY